MGVFRGGATGAPDVPRPKDGVTRPVWNEGVTRPFEAEGVFCPTRPLTLAAVEDGVTLPDTSEGVMRPLRLEATDAGREMEPGCTVAADNLVVATKTPQRGGQVKYRFLNA